VTQLRKTRPVTPEQRQEVLLVLRDGGMTYRSVCRLLPRRSRLDVRRALSSCQSRDQVVALKVVRTRQPRHRKPRRRAMTTFFLKVTDQSARAWHSDTRRSASERTPGIYWISDWAPWSEVSVKGSRARIRRPNPHFPDLPDQVRFVPLRELRVEAPREPSNVLERQ
jgi:hypothetical protein